MDGMLRRQCLFVDVENKNFHFLLCDVIDVDQKCSKKHF